MLAVCHLILWRLVTSLILWIIIGLCNILSVPPSQLYCKLPKTTLLWPAWNLNSEVHTIVAQDILADWIYKAPSLHSRSILLFIYQSSHTSPLAVKPLSFSSFLHTCWSISIPGWHLSPGVCLKETEIRKCICRLLGSPCKMVMAEMTSFLLISVLLFFHYNRDFSWIHNFLE